MTPAIALFTLAFILFRAGWKNQSLVDAALGRDTRKSTGNVDDAASYATATDPSSQLGDFPGNLIAHAGTAVIDGKRVALWIVPYVKWARAHGWGGQVTSGYRDPNQVVKPAPGLPVAPQGRSNHSGLLYPGGAIDVSDPAGFEQALRSFPGPHLLHRGTAIGDPVHFSATGR